MKKIAIFFALASCAGMLRASELTPGEVAADRKLWPRDVAVKIPFDVEIVVNGAPSGTMKMPAGRTHKVESVGQDSVVVAVAPGSLATVPIAETDLLERAASRRKELAKAAESAASRQAAATPTPQPRPSAEPPAPAATNPVGAGLDGDLVALSGKRVGRYDGAPLAGKKYVALYYSAHWCPPCRAFTPKLIEWYQSHKPSADLFEIVFVSSDRSENDMEDYIKETGMPWPAVDFKKIERSGIRKFAGRGIPCLVVIGPDGSVVSHSYQGETYVGPSRVLSDLERLLVEG